MGKRPVCPALTGAGLRAKAPRWLTPLNLGTWGNYPPIVQMGKVRHRGSHTGVSGGTFETLVSGTPGSRGLPPLPGVPSFLEPRLPLPQRGQEAPPAGRRAVGIPRGRQRPSSREPPRPAPHPAPPPTPAGEAPVGTRAVAAPLCSSDSAFVSAEWVRC